MNSIKKHIAEFIGTFVLVLFACGTAAVVGCSAENGTGYLLTALAFSSLRIKKQGEVKNFCRSHPAGPRRIGLAQSSGKSTLPTKE